MFCPEKIEGTAVGFRVQQLCAKVVRIRDWCVSDGKATKFFRVYGTVFHKFVPAFEMLGGEESGIA